MRHHSLLDKLILQLDAAIATSFHAPNPNPRPNPAANTPETKLSTAEKKHSAGLMRVNHAGEVCAQALYRGQAITARSEEIKNQMAQSGEEEKDHLAWCQERLTELNSRPSLLSFVWYTGSFALGLVAGAMGDRWSLGFLAETEKQVSQHLESHLHTLPLSDHKSSTIIEQMKAEELAHQRSAEELGAAPLPNLVQTIMRWTSKIMTTIAYHC